MQYVLPQHLGRLAILAVLAIRVTHGTVAQKEQPALLLSDKFPAVGQVVSYTLNLVHQRLS